MSSFNIWYDAVTSYLRSKGITTWCEGKVGGGYAIWGGPEVMEEISNFNKQYLKSSVRHGVLPNPANFDTLRINDLTTENVKERLLIDIKKES